MHHIKVKRIFIIILLLIDFLLINQPAYAGRINGNYNDPSSLEEYKKFTNTLSFKKDSGYLFLANVKQISTPGKLCSAVEVAPQWLVTSAHCLDNKNSATYFSENGLVSHSIAILQHKNFQASDLYFKIGCFGYPCRNQSPQKAKNDIALIRLDIPVRANELDLNRSKPTEPFQGVFLGWGDKGDGNTDSITKVSEKGYKTIIDKLKSTLSESEQRKIFAECYDNDALGGRNTYKLIDNSFLSSDFDKVVNNVSDPIYNIDNLPGLKNEYFPDGGDSGAGLFKYPTSELMGIVAGGGYGNRALSNGNTFSHASGHYGSVAFFTPIYVHSKWIKNVINLNKNSKFKYKTYIPKGTLIKVLQGQIERGLSYEIEIPDTLLAYESEILSDIYPEDEPNS